MRNNQAVIIVMLLVFALLIRIYACFFAGLQWKTIDTQSYYGFADALRQGRYAEPFMPPGYSLLIIALDHFGDRDLTMIIFNIIASMLSCLCVYFMCRRVSVPRKWSILSLAFISFYPNHVNYVRYILAETPAMLFVTASAFLYLLLENRKSGIILSACALGMAAILRTSNLPMVIFPLLVCLIKRRFSAMSLYLICFFVPVVMVLGINYFHSRKIFISNNLAINLVISSESRSDNLYYDGARNPRYQGIVDSHDAGGAFRLYLDTMVLQPREWLIKRAVSFWELWGAFPSDDGRRSVLMRAVIGIRFLLLILAIIGWRMLFRKDKDYAFVLGGPAIALTFIHVLSFSSPRYLHVVEPVVICLSAYALNKLFELPGRITKAVPVGSGRIEQ